MENCAECGKPIGMHEPSYYRMDPACCIGKSYHSACGDPMGIKAKDARIERLRAALLEIAENSHDVEACVYAREALRTDG